LPMEEARWNKIESIFNETILLPEEERAQFIRLSCLPDLELYEEIISLISAETIESAFLNSSAFTLGARILSDSKLPQTEIFAYYRLIKLLGRGGMGLVFLAEDTRLKRLVAVKLLTSPMLESKDSELRFRQEAQAASHVSHQNIAHVYEYGEYEGQHYLAMEYVRGQTLREIIKEGSINHEKAIEIVIQILEAVSAAHRQGIIHRDLKPENIIVSEDGLVKVLDFGLAKQNVRTTFDKDTSELAIVETRPGIIIGTAGYMSPEQIRGQSTDERTDLWSVGVVLYELLAGVRPFGGETSGDVHASILRDGAPLDIGWSRPLQTILKKAIQKDPSGRFQTATEFSQELQLASSRFQGKSNEFTRWPFQKVRLKIVTLSLAALLLIGAGLAFVIMQNKRATYGNREQLPAPAAFPTPRKITSLVILPFSVKGDPANNEMLTHLSYDWSEGLTDSIGSANVCLVKSANSGFQMKDVKNTYYIQSKLSVDAILRGIITNTSHSIRVEVELIDASNDTVLWHDDFETDGKQLLSLRNHLFQLISTNLQIFLSSEKRFYPYLNGDRKTSDAEENAYALYLQGRYDYDDVTDNQKARISYLQEAVKQSPSFNIAYLALAQNLSEGTERDMDSVETYALAASLSKQKYLAKSHLILGKRYLEKGEWIRAFRELEFARNANPNDAEIRYWYGQTVLLSRGQFNEALSEMEIALKIDPLSDSYEIGNGKIKLLMKDFEGALSECDKLRLRFPRNSIRFSSCTAIPLAKLGRFDEAIDALSKGVEDASDPWGFTLQAMVNALAGRDDVSRQFVSYLEERKRQGDENVSPYQLATVYAVLNDRKNVLINLKETAQSKEKPQLLFLRFESAFDGLRNDPEFRKIEEQFTVAEHIDLELK
jgi:eukaryotic-like serine/threonine-protein kinase